MVITVMTVKDRVCLPAEHWGKNSLFGPRDKPSTFYGVEHTCIRSFQWIDSLGNMSRFSL